MRLVQVSSAVHPQSALHAADNIPGRTFACGHCFPRSCWSAFVKSFGRREAYETLRGTNPRGPMTMVYGYFCFRLRVAQSRPAVGSMGRDAICPKCRWIGWVCRWGLPARAGFCASLTTDGANSIVGRNEGAAVGNCGRPCRVTAKFSRLVACSAVVRGADASARTSR